MVRSAGRSARFPVLAAVLCLLGAGTAQGASLSWQQGISDSAPLEDLRGLPRVLGELERLERDGNRTRLEPHRLDGWLEDAGPRALPELLVATGAEDRDRRADDEVDSSELLDERRTALFTASLSDHPRWAWDELPSAEPGRRVRVARRALIVLAAFGGAAELELTRDLALPLEQDERPKRSLLRAYESALGSMLRRDRRALRQLEDRFEEWPESLWTSTVKAVGSTANGEALDLLTWLLHDSEGTHVFLVQQIGRVAESSGLPGDFGLHSMLVQHANGMDSSLRREACVALGKLRCSDAIDDLIGLLTDADQGVSASAYWALQRITGKSMKGEPDRWRAWYAEEQRWWRESFPEHRENLESEDIAVVGSAIRAIGGRKLRRHELATTLLPLMEDRREPVVGMTIAALGALGSAVAVEPLVDLLASDSDELRGLAHRTLTAITGRDELPPEPAAWAAYARRP